MDLAIELSKALLRERPSLLSPSDKDSAEACNAIASLLGCQLAYVLKTKGEGTYIHALRAVFLQVDKMARGTVEKSNTEPPHSDH